MKRIRFSLITKIILIIALTGMIFSMMRDFKNIYFIYNENLEMNFKNYPENSLMVMDDSYYEFSELMRNQFDKDIELILNNKVFQEELIQHDNVFSSEVINNSILYFIIYKNQIYTNLSKKTNEEELIDSFDEFESTGFYYKTSNMTYYEKDGRMQWDQKGNLNLVNNFSGPRIFHNFKALFDDIDYFYLGYHPNRIREFKFYHQSEIEIINQSIYHFTYKVIFSLILFILLYFSIERYAKSNFLNRVGIEIYIFIFFYLILLFPLLASTLFTPIFMTTVIKGIISFLLVFISYQIIYKLRNRMLIKSSYSYRIGSFILSNFSQLLSEIDKKNGRIDLVNAYYIVFVILSFIIVGCGLLMAMQQRMAILFILICIEFMLIYITYNHIYHLAQSYSVRLKQSDLEQIKAERMKVDLITNVSHDLKTPLTSIIGYIDLLSKENDLSDTMVEYISILDKKSLQLKSLVTDLFDLAKSSSGNIEMNVEVLDLKKLVEQTLFDMEDMIQEYQHTVIVDMTDENAFVQADGKQIYRILQNIIENAIKYTLSGTRVFLTLTSVGDELKLSMINTANYIMDFDSEQVIERFNRGDSARSSEGNGLGLSIAQSFMEGNNGRLEVIISGDQFRVDLYFKRLVIK